VSQWETDPQKVLSALVGCLPYAVCHTVIWLKSSLEVLLTERVVSCWMLVELFDALMAGQLNKDNEHRTPISYTLKMLKWQESANRRYLAAIRELARVRKLQATAPPVQVNTR
jgi:hypothetical protein